LADDPSSNDGIPEALELLANFLREHEKSLDVAVDGLANAIERLRPAENFTKRIAVLEEKVDELQRQISHVNSLLRNLGNE